MDASYEVYGMQGIRRGILLDMLSVPALPFGPSSGP
jgi:hypothetical protein